MRRLLPTMCYGLCRQRGAAVVEFALIAVVFFMLLLGIIEFGRLFFLWNTVQEVTRKAAREAIVRNFATEVPAIQREAIFRDGSTGEVGLLFSQEITNLRVSITYLNQFSPRTIATPLPAGPAENISECLNASASCIRYVEAKLCVQDGEECSQVQYVPMLGWWWPGSGIHIPFSTVTMPAESLGYAI